MADQESSEGQSQIEEEEEIQEQDPLPPKLPPPLLHPEASGLHPVEPKISIISDSSSIAIPSVDFDPPPVAFHGLRSLIPHDHPVPFPNVNQFANPIPFPDAQSVEHDAKSDGNGDNDVFGGGEGDEFPFGIDEDSKSDPNHEDDEMVHHENDHNKGPGFEHILDAVSEADFSRSPSINEAQPVLEGLHRLNLSPKPNREIADHQNAPNLLIPFHENKARNEQNQWNKENQRNQYEKENKRQQSPEWSKDVEHHLHPEIDDLDDDDDLFLRYIERFGERFPFWKYIESIGISPQRFRSNKRFGGILHRHRMIDKTATALCFECIWSFLSSSPTPSAPERVRIESVQNLLRIAMQHDVGDGKFNDEVICQIVQQFEGQRLYRVEQMENGWTLLNVVVGVLMPSTELIHPLAALLNAESKSREKGDGIADIATNGLHRLHRLYKRGTPRRHTPSRREIDCVLKHKEVEIEIGFLDGTKMKVMIDAQCTAKELVVMLCHRMKLHRSNWRHFGVFAATESALNPPRQFWIDSNVFIGKLYDKKKLRRSGIMNESDGMKLTNLIFDATISGSRFLDDDESVLDVLGQWESQRDRIETEYGRNRIRSKRERAKQKENVIDSFSLQFRFRTFWDRPDTKWSELALKLWAMECSWKLVSGFVAIAASDAWELASILVQCVHGPHPDGYYTNGLLVDELYRYLPCYMTLQNKSALEVKMLTMHGQYEKMETSEAVRLYLHDFKLCCGSLYGSCFFPIVFWMNALSIWECGMLSVSEEGLNIIRPVQGYQILESIKMNEILSCRYHPDSFQFRLVIGNLAAHRVVTLFVKYHGKEIEHQIACYKENNRRISRGANGGKASIQRARGSKMDIKRSQKMKRARNKDRQHML